MSKYFWSKTMRKHAHTLPAGTAKAQAYSIATKLLTHGTIAEAAESGHIDISNALRWAYLLVDAGLGVYEEGANKYNYGTYHFVDGSTLDSHGTGYKSIKETDRLVSLILDSI